MSQNAAILRRHEPLLRVVKRDGVSFLRKMLVRLLAVLFALLLDALFILGVTGLNPIEVYVTMYDGTFGTIRRFCTALRDWAPLLLIGIALAPAFKMRFWNVGAEGQVLMGALGTALVMVYGAGVLPGGWIFVGMLAASILLGALWGLIPVIFKAKFNTNETLFTLMMNYVAIQIVSCFYNLWRGQASALGKLNKATKIGWFSSLPLLGGIKATYTITVVTALVMMVVMFLYLRYTKHGYEIAVVGESQRTARYAGINVDRVVIRTMVISGILCGITGFLLVAGRDQTIATTTAGGDGFTAIIVTWMAKFNTFYMALISFLLIFLEKGAAQIASAYKNLNEYAANIITGIILFCLLGSEFFLNYRLVFRTRHHKEVG